MSGDSCVVCGGDGQLQNSFGNTARCPACHGTGRRSEGVSMRDVTKTKPSHHRAPGTPPPVTNNDKPTWPSTAEGMQLAEETKACASLSTETRARITREIIEYEGSHGRCTQTFSRKVRKQLRPPA